jgi:hypothetical protein
MTQIADDLKSQILTDDIFVLLWAALRHEDKNLTVEQVEDMITPRNLKYIIDKFYEAFEAAMPEKEGAKKEGSPLDQNLPAG